MTSKHSITKCECKGQIIRQLPEQDFEGFPWLLMKVSSHMSLQKSPVVNYYQTLITTQVQNTHKMMNYYMT